MIPVSSNYNLQGMSTLNFNNIITNPSQATLPISALGNILQLHCNPSLTLQVNSTSPMIPVTTKESLAQDQLTSQMNTLRNIFPSQLNYQKVTQTEQCTDSSQRSFNQLIQELLSTYQDQQENLSQLTIKYNFLLNAMERLLFDVQNNVEYSLLALGISQTINKVKLNQINQLNQLNCASLISNGVIPMINQSHLFSSCTQLSSSPTEITPISSVIDLTNQRPKPDSTTTVVSTMDKKVDLTKTDFHTLNNSSKKMTSLDKLDKLIDETVKKSTNRMPIADNNSLSPTSKSMLGNEHVQTPINTINYSMGNAIQQIIRQFYQNASLNSENIGLNGTTTTESNYPSLPVISSRSHMDHIKTSMNNFSQQVTEIIGNTTIPFNNLANRTNHSFILCSNLATNSILNTRREPLAVSMNTAPKDSIPQTISEIPNDNNNLIDEMESNGLHEDEDMDPAELDPTEVATRIRDILSLHSIGQRLFAKHVLNLSQGTVSELLSKPKPWSKLSEKGRDSYRKMNQWAQDSVRVQELKSIAPRKGFSGHYAGISPATPIKEDHETQEKIKRILNDAKMAMASTTSNQQSNTDDEHLYNYTKLNDFNQNIQSNECNQIISMSSNPQVSVVNDISSNVQIQKKMAALQSTVISGSIVTDSLPQISSSLNCQQSPLILMNFANLVPSSLVMNSISSNTNPSLVPIVNTHIIPDKSSLDNNEIKSEPIINHSYSSENSEIGTTKCTTKDNDNEEKTAAISNLDMELASDQLEVKSVQTSNYKPLMEQKHFEKLLKSIISPSKFTEDSLLNEEINTTALVNLIKEHLTKNSISQRTFGCLLDFHQNEASLKKMAISPKIENEMESELQTNNNNEQHNNSKTLPQTNKFICKKGRIVFTESQKAELLSVYEICPYPKSEHLEEISKKLNIPMKTINNWFHNYRMRNKNAKCLTQNCANEHESLTELSGNKMEVLSVESDNNSEKSAKDESYVNGHYSFDESESEGSMPAPRLYPESTALECISLDNSLNGGNSFIDDDSRFCANNSMHALNKNIAGSNKRKRANPIKLEMVVSKIFNKEATIQYSRAEDIPISQGNSPTLSNLCKVPKLE